MARSPPGQLQRIRVQQAAVDVFRPRGGAAPEQTVVVRGGQELTRQETGMVIPPVLEVVAACQTQFIHPERLL